MSDEIDFDEGDGVKSLRAALEKANKELAALRTENRSTSLEKAFSAKSVDTKYMALYNADDISPDAVGAWAEQFGFTAAPAAAPSAPVTDPNVLAAQRVANASFGATEATLPPANGPMVPGNLDEALHVMKTAPIEQLIELGWIQNPRK